MATHLQLRERQLQRSAALYRHLIQDALDGIFVVDRELRFVAFNRAHAAMMRRLYGVEIQAGSSLRECMQAAPSELSGRGQFRAGMLRVLKETPVPVIPLALSNLWGSMFSRFATSVWSRLPRRYLARITLAAGEPIAPGNATLENLRSAVTALRIKP